MNKLNVYRKNTVQYTREFVSFLILLMIWAQKYTAYQINKVKYKFELVFFKNHSPYHNVSDDALWNSMVKFMLWFSIICMATIVLASVGGRPSPRPIPDDGPELLADDSLLYDDTLNHYSSVAARYTKYDSLVSYGTPGGGPWWFFLPDDTTNSSYLESIIDSVPYGTSSYVMRVRFTGDNVNGSGQATSDNSVKKGAGAAYADSTHDLFVQFWVRIIDSSYPNPNWLKGIELFHPSGQGGGRTQFGPFLAQGHSLSIWNVHPYSNNTPIWWAGHAGGSAPDSFRTWGAIKGKGYLRWTVLYRQNDNRTNDSQDCTVAVCGTSGIAKLWIEDQKLLDASNWGAQNGWMKKRVNSGASTPDGNIDWKYCDPCADTTEALQKLSHAVVNNIVFPGIYERSNVNDTVTLDIGRVRIFLRPRQ